MAFVSNGGWIDGKTATGVRLSLADEYSGVYVYNLRGNQVGDWKREGGKVFGEGSQTTIAIFVGVKNSAHTGPCEIFYRDIGDFLSREQKLEIIDSGRIDSIDWQPVIPNDHGDWINQRSVDFGTWPAIGDKGSGAMRVFAQISRGFETGRDAWVYNYSHQKLTDNVQRLVTNYNEQLGPFAAFAREHGVAKPREDDVTAYLHAEPTAADEDRIKWTSSLKQHLSRGLRAEHRADAYRAGSYRPFQAMHVYFGPMLGHRRGELDTMFPTPHHENIGILVMAPRESAQFGALMANRLPDLSFFTMTAQFCPRWTYQKAEPEDGALELDTDAGAIDEYGYRRVDNITDAILAVYRAAIGDQVTKDDIFFSIYGQLHDPTYRQAFAADLKKMLPHIPTPNSRTRFEQLAAAGRSLSDLHVGYESVEPHTVDVILKPGTDPEDRETWRVSKLKWAKKTDLATDKSVDDVTTLIYNAKVTIGGIPEAADRYMIGSRSALAWVIDRYQVKTDRPSGIVNDPNDWCDEHDDPRYVVDLLAKVTTVAVESMKVVDSLAESADG